MHYCPWGYEESELGARRDDRQSGRRVGVRVIVPQVLQRAPDGVLLVTTNPVDVLTWATLSASAVPPERVIGSGTIHRHGAFPFTPEPALWRRCARSVHAHIIGEHGDTEVAAWSIATIGGTPLADFQAARGRTLDTATRERIVTETGRAAYEIIDRTGATYYAVAAGVVRIIRAILRDESGVLTVSSLLAGSYGLAGV